MATTFTTDLSVLNAIAIQLGGDGGHTDETSAWTEIDSIGITIPG